MSLKASVLDKNGVPVGMECAFAGGTLPVYSIPFTDLRVVGEFWATPVKDGWIMRGYKYTTTIGTVSAPTVDSFKVTKVEDRLNGTTYVLVADQSAIEGASDGDTLAPNTVPVIIPDGYVCVNTAGNYVWTWQAPTKTGSQEYKANVLVDGVQAVAPLSTGHASVAAMVTWLNSNYSSAGTWTNPSGNLVVLTTATQKKVGLVITVGDFS